MRRDGEARSAHRHRHRCGGTYVVGRDEIAILGFAPLVVVRGEMGGFDFERHGCCAVDRSMLRWCGGEQESRRRGVRWRRRGARSAMGVRRRIWIGTNAFPDVIVYSTAQTVLAYSSLQYSV